MCVPRFSRVAFVSVMLLIGSGTGASIIHLPTLASLWQTSYGKAIIVKVGAARAARCCSPPVNLAAQHAAAAGGGGAPRTRPPGRRRCCAGSSAARSCWSPARSSPRPTLSSLPPPPKALASIGAVSAHVGPGPVTETVDHDGYRLDVRVDPNRAAVPNAFSVAISKDGKPVRRADVTATFTMLDMEMGQLAYHLPETAPGRYGRSAPALVMVGHWGLTFDITPSGAQPVHRPPRRQGQRMTATPKPPLVPLNLVLALIALAAGAAAVIIVVLLAVHTLG